MGLLVVGKIRANGLLIWMIIFQAGIKQDQLTFVQGPEAELKYHRTFTSSPSTFGEEQIAPLSKNFRSLLIHLGGMYDAMLSIIDFYFLYCVFK